MANTHGRCLGTPQPVTYGSEIVLVDTVSGTQTAPLIIRKVDKGRIAADDGGPVSQMQKIALQRVSNDSTRHYLSAVGPVPGTPGLVISTTPGLSNQTGTHPLLFQIPRVREETKDGLRVITDEVDDYLCWTIVGICTFMTLLRSTEMLRTLMKLYSKVPVYVLRRFRSKYYYS